MNTENKRIEWKIHCASSTQKIFHLLDSNEGRKSFWAESAEEIDGEIYFVFINGQAFKSKILSRTENTRFSLIYFDTLVNFNLETAEDGGTDLTLVNENIPLSEYKDMKAGWVSVLLTLKAYADFGVDLRNHNKQKTWDEGYVDN